MTYTDIRYEQVAIYIASILEPQWLINEPNKLIEHELYLIALTAILSSQVPYEVAQVYAKNISRMGRRNGAYLPLSYSDVLKLLQKSISYRGHDRHYRFPNTRAVWISGNQKKLVSDSQYFSRIIYSGTDPVSLRSWLSTNICGLGLKQASMFMQIALMSDCFAILDRHILRYLNIIGLLPMIPKNLSSRAYFDIEDIFIRHARFRGFGIGLFDHATWITMRSLSNAS